MTKRQEATALLFQGKSPGEIARITGDPMPEVRTQLLLQVSEGALRRSDILYSFAPSSRLTYEDIYQRNPTKEYFDLIEIAETDGIDREEFRLYLDCRGARISRGDMYEYVSEIELTLHQKVKQILVRTFGEGENGWWRKGIPAQIRTHCQSTRENDPEPVEDVYAYTTLIDLKKIMDDNWPVFNTVLPQRFGANKKSFFAEIDRLNSLRNGIMHPVKQIDIDEATFVWARDLNRALQKREWRLGA